MVGLELANLLILLFGNGNLDGFSGEKGELCIKIQGFWAVNITN
jgi:hypothetical protein